MKALLLTCVFVLAIIPVVCAETVSVSVGANGQGSILVQNSSGVGILACSSGTCSKEIAAGTQLTISAQPALGSVFGGWSGTGSGSVCHGTAPCAFQLTANSSFSVSFFDVDFTMTVQAADIGSGSIHGKTQTGAIMVNCLVTDGQANGPGCTRILSAGMQLVFSALPDSESSFVGWSGGSGSASACTGSGPCTFVLSQNSSLKGSFRKATTTFSMDMTIVGTGSGDVEGTIDSGAVAMNCSINNGVFLQGPFGCSKRFASGTHVKFTAEAKEGSVFSGWKSFTCSTSKPCTVLLNSNSSLQATFTREMVTLTVKVLGSGSVTFKDKKTAAVLLGCKTGTCTKEIPKGTSIQMSAQPAPLGSFMSWSDATGGASSCNGIPLDTCSFEATANSSIQGNFTKN